MNRFVVVMLSVAAVLLAGVVRAAPGETAPNAPVTDYKERYRVAA